ncbi:MAG: hypothetical protein ACE5E5_10245 [Phycisphaerae bacterium]
MNRGNDPVDKVFDSLRTQSWSADSYDPYLEKQLMQEFDRRSGGSRFTPTRGFAIAMLVLVVGGGAYATSSVILSLMHVTVEVDGETTEFDIASNGEALFRVETADGGTADVTVKSTEGENGEHMREINVTTAGDGTEDGECVKVVRKCNGSGPTPVDWEVLGDAEPVGNWTDAAGVDHALYAIASDEGGGSRLYMGVDPEGDDRQLFLLAEPPIDLTEFDLSVSVDENGTISIAADDGEGRELALQFRVGGEGDGADQLAEELAGDLNVASPDGTVRIEIRDAD